MRIPVQTPSLKALHDAALKILWLEEVHIKMGILSPGAMLAFYHIKSVACPFDTDGDGDCQRCCNWKASHYIPME